MQTFANKLPPAQAAATEAQTMLDQCIAGRLSPPDLIRKLDELANRQGVDPAALQLPGEVHRQLVEHRARNPRQREDRNSSRDFIETTTRDFI